MKHQSNVAAGKFLIVVLSLVVFHFYSLMLHSSLWGEQTPNNNIEQLQRVQGNDIKCNLMMFYMGDRVERKYHSQFASCL